MEDFENKDLVSYLPETVDEASLETARDFVEDLVREALPEVDTRPNSVAGDHIISPLAHMVARMNVGYGRLMSDLRLSQVAQGIVYNCDFVREFLKNFSVSSGEAMENPAWGTIRLSFPSATSRVINRGTRFRFGPDTVFRLRSGNPGPFYARGPGDTFVSGTNQFLLKRIDDEVWAVDLPVEGIMDFDVNQGDAATTDQTIEDLLAITAAATFNRGVPDLTIAELAQRAIAAQAGRSLHSRRGAQAFVLERFPDVVHQRTVVTGDPEMYRGAGNAFGVPAGTIDFYGRGIVEYTDDTRVIRLQYSPPSDPTQTDDYFYGRLTQREAVLFVNELRQDERSFPFITFSQSRDPVRAPLLSAARSALEDVWIQVNMPYDTEGEQLIRVVDENTPDAHAFFEVDIEVDPIVENVFMEMDSPDSRPAGIELLPKASTPIEITSFTMNHVRRSGAILDHTAAREKLYDYLNRVTYPRIVSRAVVADILALYGNAELVDVDVEANMQPTCADYVFPDNADPEGDFENAVANALPTPSVSISTLDGLNADFDFSSLYCRVNRKNRTILLRGDSLETSLKFVEKADV